MKGKKFHLKTFVVPRNHMCLTYGNISGNEEKRRAKEEADLTRLESTQVSNLHE